MNDLLSNPAMQSGVLPALAAALAAALFARTRALVLVPLAGLAVVVWLAVGLTLEPLTARSKLVLGVAAAGAVALVLELLQVRARAPARVLLAVLGAAGALWIGMRVLQQMEGAALWSTSLLLVAYAVAMVEASQGRAGAGDELRTLAVGVVLGFAIGALGLQGASASVAMMGIALGASCAIGVLALLWRARAPLGLAHVGLPLAAFAVFAGEVANLTGELPGRALAPLPLVVLAARWRPPRRQSTPAWRDALVTLVAAAVPAAAALALAVWPRGAASG